MRLTCAHFASTPERQFQLVLDAVQLAVQGRLGRRGRASFAAILGHVSQVTGVPVDHELYGDLSAVMSRVSASGRIVHQRGRDGGWILTDLGRKEVGLPAIGAHPPLRAKRPRSGT